jgi:hypothetical protein
MPLDFPTSPSLNEIYTFGGRSWIWNGTAWDVYSTASGDGVTELNGLTGGVTIAAGTNITLTPVGNTITIDAAGGSGGSGITGPYVISFNGLTGAVTGVSSIRGLTGAVGITNGSGIGLSVSGNTLTILNTGVLSFNGFTGTATGVSSIFGITGSVGLTNGSGIDLLISGNTLTVSNAAVLSFNGLTGAVTGVTTGIANTFGSVQSFTNGIIVTGATMSGTVSITGVVTPTTDLDAANKFYVDSVASTGIHYHQPVVLASTDAETFASGVTYDNGASGVGAFLRKTSSFARINIDGIDGSTGDRILVRSASTQQWNGVYDVTNQGDGSTGWILTRSSDADNYHPHDQDGLGENDYFFVQNGTTLKGNAYICSVPGGITFGTTAITFALFSTPPVYTAGTGLALNSLQFSNTGVLSFNGLTGAVTGVTTGTENTFGPLQRFTNGISASNGITLTGRLYMPFNSSNDIYLDAPTVYLGDINYNYDNAHIQILQDPAIYLYGGGGSFVSISGNSIDTTGGSVNLGNLTINGSQGSNNQVLTSTGSGITWASVSGSGISRSIFTITGSTTAGSNASTDYVYNGNTSGNITLTMPTAASNTNRYTIKNSNTGILTVSTTSSETIDGVTAYYLNKQYQAIDLLSNNSNWFIV